MSDLDLIYGAKTKTPTSSAENEKKGELLTSNYVSNKALYRTKQIKVLKIKV
jgi:hypothetical protein